MFNASDIEIFILTYNRALLLSYTLKSVINQNTSGARICVLDNGSVDKTSEIVASFGENNVEYIKNAVNDHIGAWNQIKSLSSRSWTMIFHDDDLLHPNYIGVVLDLVNQYPEISLVGSSMSASYEPSADNWNLNEGKEYYFCPRYSDLAYLLFKGFPLPFCSAVYKADVFRELSIDRGTYGKIFDRPFMMDVSKVGGAVLLKGKYVRSRLHVGQDSNSLSKESYLSELIALNRYYFKALGQNVFNKFGRLFLLKSYSRLISAYEWADLDASGLTKSQFIEMAIKGGATTKTAVNIGSVYFLIFGWPLRLVKRLLRPFSH